ncbi:MAG TPA: CPBP family intramembrane glutamic endopeptidase [Mycobacteriales bacterium]|nr:CPBP family intramembrane glutamic endopeptidase [Mycobacteriales bacterium]
MTQPVIRRSVLTPTTLAVVFAAAVTIRVALSGAQGAASRGAGLVFALVLAVTVVACHPSTRVSARAIAIGLAAGAVLVLPALLHVVTANQGWRPTPAGGFAGWAVVTAVVATAEEGFLRGALYDAVARRRGPDVAIAVTALAFGLLHVPFYGWHVLPLDVAVGICLGVTRWVAGTWTAPAVAHVAADLAGWWLL